MPNWTTNHIRVSGPAEVLKQIRDLVRGETKGEDGVIDHFDFNRMVPMPAILARVVSPARQGDNGRTILYPKVRAANDPFGLNGQIEATEEEQKELDVCKPYESWYDWSNANWGTKWLAHAEEWDVSLDGTVMSISFDTAWDAPRPIFEKFAEFLEAANLEFEINCVHEGGEQFERLHQGNGVCFAEVKSIAS